MRQGDRQKRNYIIIGLCAVVMIMVVGFAVFSQQLQINSTSEVTSNWDIEITDIDAYNPNGGSAYDVTPPSYTPTTANFSTGLISPGDFRVYQVEVSNLGTLTGEVSIASLSCGNNGAIGCNSFKFDGKIFDDEGNEVSNLPSIPMIIHEGTDDYSELEFTLEPNEKHYLYIVVRYNDVVTQPVNTSANITLTLTYVQSSSDIPTPIPEPQGDVYYAFNTLGVPLNTNVVYIDSYELEYSSLELCQHESYNPSSCVSETISVEDRIGTETNWQNLNKNVFNKYVVSDGVILAAYACVKFDNISEPVCLRGISNESSSIGEYSEYYDVNERMLERLDDTFDEQGVICSQDNISFECTLDSLHLYNHETGVVEVTDFSSYEHCGNLEIGTGSESVGKYLWGCYLYYD